MSTKSAKLQTFICPSILACDFTKLGDEINLMKSCGADRLHLDIMDGHFVPNISFGMPVIKSIKNISPKWSNEKKKYEDEFYLDCHMMVSNPEKWIEPIFNIIYLESSQLCETTPSCGFTFHLEATNDPISLIKKIKNCMMNVGIAINPDTPINKLVKLLNMKDVYDNLDLVLIMSVNPGFGGQSFIEGVLPKIRILRELFPTLNIQVDGGITMDNIELVSKSGANNIVAGSSIFKSENPKKTIDFFKNICNANSD